MLAKNNPRLSLLSRLTPGAAQANRKNPLDAQAQERQAGRNAQDYAMSCYHIVFNVLPFMLSDIPGPRLISREDAHPMYPQYLRVSLYVIFTAHSPTDL